MAARDLFTNSSRGANRSAEMHTKSGDCGESAATDLGEVMSTRINLNKLAREITLAEGREQRHSIAQIKETLGILGSRWRNMTGEEVQQEVECIRERAGISSQHRGSE